MKKYILIYLLIFMGCGEQEHMKREIPTSSKKVIKESHLTATDVKNLIGNMFIVGFYGTDINATAQIVEDIREYHIGGVILFDKHPSRRGEAKNIKNPEQLRELTQNLQNYSDYPLLIAIDQEGGKVARLKRRTGFKKDYPSANSVSKIDDMRVVKEIYEDMGRTLFNMGINLNFAPSVDMEINPKNVVIVKLKRSYGKEPKEVIKFSKIFIKAMNDNSILTSIKHFPGHGSSMGDTHKGFVDITNSWKRIELEPYKALIGEGLADTIMVAHVFNKNIDDKYPSSLSYKSVTKILREKLGYRGVVVTDDLQMYAISKHFSLEETIKLSINAGVDLLLFGNQLDPKHKVSVEMLVETTFKLVEKREIKLETIIKANHRIDRLKERINNEFKEIEKFKEGFEYKQRF